MVTVMFLAVLSILCFAKILIQGLFLIHKLQQLGYANSKFLQWLEGHNYRKILVWNLFELFIPLLVIMIFYFWKETDIKIYKILTALIMISVFVWKLIHPFIAGWVGNRTKIKKPLVYTARVRRLIFTLSLLIIWALIAMIRFTAYPFDAFSIRSWSFFQFNAFILLFSVITPMFVLAGNVINYPLEKGVHALYYFKAKRKLAKSTMQRIGITGSFGKTSTKFFLATILAEKYKTLTTPSSFNTPMGISMVVNGTALDEYQWFVAEMGADHVGDIKVLSRLVQHEAGIITSVGVQHLETFGTPENILKTKLELFDAIPDRGFGIYNYDSLMLRNGVAERNYAFRLYAYSADPANKNVADIYADEIQHTREGLSFTACFKDGSKIYVMTELLGRHNVQNLLGAVMAARLLGLTDAEVVRGVKAIKSVDHRLQRIDSGNGILVLDDAFNSNYAGALEAVNVMDEIGCGGNRVIVTPGFVELGEEEDRYNCLFGEYMASRVTHALLVGAKKTNSIKEGLLNGGMPYDRIFTVASLAEAQILLGKILKKGDVVLFENDLPDTYSEV